MTEAVIIGGATLICADVVTGLRGLADGSVHCVITSPPYWGLRDYGTATWEGGDAKGCAHVCNHGAQGKTGQRADRTFTAQAVYREVCGKCGARRIDAQLGLEATPGEYVEKMVEVFREVRRVMREDGTLWLNMGDSYCAAAKGSLGGQDKSTLTSTRTQEHSPVGVAKDRAPGLKPKDLCEIPSDVVRALRADGWWLRCRIPWLKRNAMPESTRDRPASAVEYVFLLTKSDRYFYDGEAVRIPHKTHTIRHTEASTEYAHGLTPEEVVGRPVQRGGKALAYAYAEGIPGNPGGRARRNSDWFFESWQGLYDEGEGPLAFIVNPAAFKGSHFATFPPRLVEPCIKPGTSEKGCCPKCGAPWRRVVGSQRIQTRNIVAPKSLSDDADRANVDPGRHIRASSTLGWSPTCSDYEAEWERWWQEWSATASRTRCARKRHQQDAADRWTSRARASLRRGPLPYGEVAPCTVLDPFGGAGTVSLLANRLGRRSIYIDLSPKYVEMAAERLRKDSAPATHVSEQEGEAPLFAGQESDHD